MSEFTQAAKEDWSSSDLKGKSMLIGSGLMMVAHEVGMEALLGYSGGVVLTEVQNPLAAPLAVGIAMSAISRVVEEGVTHVTSSVVDKFPAVTGILEERARLDELVKATERESTQRDDNSPRRESRLTQFKESYQKTSATIGLGSSGAIIREHTLNPSNNHADNIRHGRKAAWFLAKFNFGLGFVISGGAKLIDQLGVNASGIVVPVAKSPVTWGAVFALGRVSGYFDHRKKKKQRERLKDKLEDYEYNIIQSKTELT